MLSPVGVPCLAKQALFLVCQHECDVRIRMDPVNVDTLELVRLISTTRTTAKLFGGLGLGRGLNPYNSVHGSLLSDALLLSERAPETLSTLLVAKVCAGASVNPAFGRYIAPDDMRSMIASNCDRARPFVTLSNVGHYIRTASARTRPEDAEMLIYSATAALRQIGGIATLTPSELCSELTWRVLLTDISECVTTGPAAADLLLCARASEQVAVDAGDAIGVAASVARNLRRFEDLEISTIYEALNVVEASAVLLFVAPFLKPQQPPRESILAEMWDASKVYMLDRGIWTVSDFDHLLALRICDPYEVLQASITVDVPMSWMMDRARDVIRDPVTGELTDARIFSLRWPILGIWGPVGMPIRTLFTMFGSDSIAVIASAPDFVDVVEATLTDLFRTLSDWDEHELYSCLAARAAASLCRIAKIRGRRYGAGDVKDAFKLTPVGRAACGLGDVDAFGLVSDIDRRGMGLSDVCDLCKRIDARQHAVSQLIQLGSKFGTSGHCQGFAGQVCVSGSCGRLHHQVQCRYRRSMPRDLIEECSRSNCAASAGSCVRAVCRALTCLERESGGKNLRVGTTSAP